MTIFGRPALYVTDLAVMTGLLLIIPFRGIWPGEQYGTNWSVGSILLIYALIDDITVGPVLVHFGNRFNFAEHEDCRIGPQLL